MSEPDGNSNDIGNNCKLVKDTIDNLLDAFNILEKKIDSMGVGDRDIDKYQDKMQELRQQNIQLKSELTSLQEKEFRMAVLLSMHEQSKLKKIEQLRKERIKTKITNLCRNQLGIVEKLDIQRPLRSPNKKEITADVWIKFENEENLNKLLNNILKLTDCKVIVRKQPNKKSKTKNVEKDNENAKKKSMMGMGKYLLRFRQEIKQKKETEEFI